jgi:hypothetical protein
LPWAFGHAGGKMEGQRHRMLADMSYIEHVFDKRKSMLWALQYEFCSQLQQTLL